MVADAAQRIYPTEPSVGDVVQVVADDHPAFALLGVVFQVAQDGRGVKLYVDDVQRNPTTFTARSHEVVVIGKARKKRKDYIQ